MTGLRDQRFVLVIASSFGGGGCKTQQVRPVGSCSPVSSLLIRQRSMMFVIILAFLSVNVVDQVLSSSECLTTENKKCVFPFKVKEKTHIACTRDGDPENR